MLNRFWNIAVMAALLTGNAFSAFIQSPIPPSSQENYFIDNDGDGRLDGISIKLLGNADQAYLDQMVDSLTFDWIDSASSAVHVVVPKSSIKLESSRELFVDLAGKQPAFDQFTASYLKTSGLSSDGVKLFLSDGTTYGVVVKDQMVPVIKDAVLHSYRGLQTDTLTLQFSESMKVSLGCESFLDYKSAKEGLVQTLPMSAVLWNESATEALVILNEGSEVLLPKDSIRLSQGCIGDSLGNDATKDSRFVPVPGFYPIEISTSSMVVARETANGNTPVFQLLFETDSAHVPNEDAWGVSMEAMSEEFLNGVRNTLGLASKTSLDLSKLNIHYNVRIYTNLGSFVVGTSADVKGSDSRFEGSAKRLFLKWNLMDGTRRLVSTGVYIANIIVQVTYDGKFIFRNDVHHGPTTLIFGVKRRN